MATIWSYRAGRNNIQLIQKAIRNGPTQINHQTITLKVPVRYGGGGMVRSPSRFHFRQWLNDVNFYIYLGLVPIAAVVTGANLFVGQAELADIPEGYEPKEWEYFKHPIHRFLVKYYYDSAQTIYERQMDQIAIEHHKKIYRELTEEVTVKMRDRADVKGWYYMPVNTMRVYHSREVVDKWKNEQGRPI